MSIHVDIQTATDCGGIPAGASFEQWVTAALSGVDRSEGEISIRIVDEPESADLNQQYRNKSGPTNVLSFPADLPQGVELPLLGDLVICAPLVHSEASEQNKAAEAHWAHLVVHGTLHLLGYDHLAEAEAEEMEALECSILAAMNYPDPYKNH